MEKRISLHRSNPQLIYQFKKKNISLVRERLKLPNGYPVTAEIVVHPGAVVIVPILNKNQVLLLRQYRLSIKKYLYEFPAGTINPGEQPLSCAKRELREETGYGGEIFRKVGKIFPVPGYSTELIYIYRADGLQPQPMAKDPDEVIDVRTFTLSQIRDLFRKGNLVDAKTICALAFCGLV